VRGEPGRRLLPPYRQSRVVPGVRRRNRRGGQRVANARRHFASQQPRGGLVLGRSQHPRRSRLRRLRTRRRRARCFLHSARQGVLMTDLDRVDLAHVLHPNTNLAALHRDGPLVLVRGEGIHVWDNRGKQYIEAMAGLWCTTLGYGDEELARVAYEQIKKLSFSHLFTGKSHEPGVLLAEKLVAMAPFAASRAFFGNSGSDANDTQIKLVWYYNNALGRPAKKKIIARHKGYHGTTLASAGLTGLPSFHKLFDVPLPGILHTDAPYLYRGAEAGEREEDYASRLAANLEKLIVREGPDTIAAFIAEPLMGVGGVLLPPRTYFEKVQAVLAKYDV